MLAGGIAQGGEEFFLANTGEFKEEGRLEDKNGAGTEEAPCTDMNRGYGVEIKQKGFWQKARALGEVSGTLGEKWGIAGKGPKRRGVMG